MPLEIELEAYTEELTLTASGLSNNQINRAGKVLSAGVPGAETEQAYTVVNEWRASHSYPLRAIATVLRRNAVAVNRYALVSSRLKRMESISAKLQRQNHMDLINMQDIGGCRAVMWYATEVPAVVDKLKLLFVEDGPFKPKYYDYIEKPKKDGYRGFHIAVRYQSKSPVHAHWSGRRIEIQIRSTLQHAWSTAVETVDLFANEKLKVGQGSSKWARFFLLASAVFARREDSPLVPGVPDSSSDSKEELKILARELNVYIRLSAWTTAMTHISSAIVDGATYLIMVDTEQKNVTIVPFGPPYIVEANKQYAIAEMDARTRSDRSVVLVSVDKITDLQKAFPNYYADTADFLKAIHEELGDWSEYK